MKNKDEIIIALLAVTLAGVVVNIYMTQKYLSPLGKAMDDVNAFITEVKKVLPTT